MPSLRPQAGTYTHGGEKLIVRHPDDEQTIFDVNGKTFTFNRDGLFQNPEHRQGEVTAQAEEKEHDNGPRFKVPKPPRL